MATKVGASPSSVGLDPSVLADSTPGQVSPGADLKKSAKTGISEAFSTDALDALKSAGLTIHSAKAAKISGPEIPNASVLSEFPLSDLGQVKTSNRWAQGFRLDGGSLRLMWMNVRRTQDQDGSAGFEVFFQAQGPAIENYKKRLEQAGAKSGTYKFFNSDVDTTTADKAVLKKTGADWGPSSQQTLSLEQPGQWAVDYVTSSPEALKGSFRIRLKGTDAEATAALGDVIKKLGLQALFSPPAPNALERFKLLRFMWQVAPGAADHLRFKPMSMLAEGLKEPVETAQLDPAAEKAIAELVLETPEMKERAQLAELLYEKSPKAFLDWNTHQSGTNGMMLSAGQADQSLRNALVSAGIPADSQELKDALAKEPSAEAVRPLFLLSLLAKKDRAVADAVVARDIETVKLPELQAALTKAGIDPLGERVKNLRFEEVYPGYFTVTDPSLSAELEKAGARYLYSTSDNAERVWQMLTGGQKSSMTRFQEGVLIQGKSSDSDFGTGGAFSVFSRLVTDSIIKKAKQETTASGGYSYSPTAFYDWGGSRPFKLILNRRILDRTDWYGYNGDNFGRSTGLTAENHGQRIVNTINGAFSSSNEVMFPVGNDPSFVDYVVAPSEEKKKELIDFLTSKGIQDFNGKALEDFVIVKTKLFELPSDMTLASAIADAIASNGFSAPITGALEQAKEVAVKALTEKLGPLADELLLQEAPAAIKSNASWSASSAASTAVTAALLAKPEALASLGLDTMVEAVTKVAAETVEVQAKQYLANAGYYSTYYLDSAIEEAVSPKYPVEKLAEVVAQAVDKYTAEHPLPSEDTPATRQVLRSEIREAIRAALKAFGIEATKADGVEAAKAKIEKMVTEEVPASISSSVQSAANTAVSKAAIAAAPPEAVQALIGEIEASAVTTAKANLLSIIQSSASSWLDYSVKNKIQTEAKKVASESILTEATPKAMENAKEGLAELVKKTTADFQAKSPEKVTPEEEAKVAGAVETAFRDLLTAASTTVAQSVATEQTSSQYFAAVQKLSDGPLFEQVALELMTEQAHQTTVATVEQNVQKALLTKFPTLVSDAVKAGVAAAAEAVKPTMVEQLLSAALERVGTEMSDNWWWTVSGTQRVTEAVEKIMAKLVPPPPPEPAPAEAPPAAAPTAEPAPAAAAAAETPPPDGTPTPSG